MCSIFLHFLQMKLFSLLVCFTNQQRFCNFSWPYFRHQVRGAETRGDGKIYPPNNLTLSPPIIWKWSTSVFHPIHWLRCASERRSPLEFGKKSAPVLVKTFFLVFTRTREKKSVPVLAKTFFFGLYLICSPKKNRGRGSSPQCWK